MVPIDREFHLDEQQKALLAALAETTGKSWDIVLSEALQAYRGAARAASGNGMPPVSVADAMREAGLLGCLHDTPSDLSTNPSYMEGFGEHGE
jgi:hypothetical protein